ncbi:hypothetical protein RB195_004537 [Necator americanus]|uniref:Uncharacterized protein n=1 Tax=Necator americanus TaxID=51031 RepID=A0ABR1BME1_NECAM
MFDYDQHGMERSKDGCLEMRNLCNVQVDEQTTTQCEQNVIAAWVDTREGGCYTCLVRHIDDMTLIVMNQVMMDGIGEGEFYTFILRKSREKMLCLNWLIGIVERALIEVRSFNMLSTLYRTQLQPMSYECVDNCEQMWVSSRHPARDEQPIELVENRLRFFAHILRKPADRLFNVFDEFVELKLKKASAPIGSLLAKLPWLKRKFVTERQRANYKVVNRLTDVWCRWPYFLGQICYQCVGSEEMKRLVLLRWVKRVPALTDQSGMNFDRRATCFERRSYSMGVLMCFSGFAALNSMMSAAMMWNEHKLP